MSSLDQLASSIPVDQLAAQLGADPEAVRQAIQVALPALVQGLDANAQDPGGAASLSQALAQHDPELATDPIDPLEADPVDGEQIVRHIYGDQTDEVVHQLGGVGGSSDLIQKLLPYLAPIVLSYLAKQMGSGSGSGGLLGQVLQQVLTGAAQGSGSASQSGGALGGILGDLLGGLLGGGRKS